MDRCRSHRGVEQAEEVDNGKDDGGSIDESLRRALYLERFRGTPPWERDLKAYEIDYEAFPRDLLDDEDIVWEIKDWAGFNFGMASPRLQGDRDFVLKIMRYDGKWLQYVSADLRADREVVMAAVSSWGIALSFARGAPLRDFEVVMKAVKNAGFALKYASDDLKNNFWIVLAAVKENGNALLFASPELRAIYDIVKAAVTLNGQMLHCASKSLQNNYWIVKTAIEQNYGAYRYASDELKAHPDLFGAVLCQNNSLFRPPTLLKSRVQSVVGALQDFRKQGGEVRGITELLACIDENVYRVFVEDVWKPRCRSKVIALHQALVQNKIYSHSIDWVKIILDFSDIPKEFRMASELIRLSPIFSALAADGIPWEGAVSLLERGLE